MVYLTFSANYLIEVDSLAGNWYRGIHSDWEKTNNNFESRVMATFSIIKSIKYLFSMNQEGTGIREDKNPE